MLVAVVLGLINTLLKPLLLLLTLPVTLLTLGLFIFVINALLFMLAGNLVDGFQVGVAGESFVLPLDQVIECVDLGEQKDLNDLLNLRGEPLPFIRLRELFALSGEPPPRESLVVVQQGSQRVGLVVDPMSLQYLVGGAVDYTEGLEGSRFIVTNPNAKSTCGCGSSFSV